MLATQLRILRVFGLSAAEVAAVLRKAQEEGCSGLRLLEKDGEFAVCVQASAPTQTMATAYCDKWVQKLSARFDAAVYGTGEISLAQAALDALLKKRRLIVAADEQTGKLIGALLRPLAHSEAAFDFGTQTYADPAQARRIVTPQTLLKRFPGDVLQAAAGRAQLALQAGGADYAAVYMPATVGQAPFVLVCDKRAATACAISPELSNTAIANAMLDLARRRALGIRLSNSTVTFHPGHETPLLLVSQEGQMTNSFPPEPMRRPLHTGSAKTPFATQGSGTDSRTMEYKIPSAGVPAENTAAHSAAEIAAVAVAAKAAAARNWQDKAPARKAGAPVAPAAPSGTITFEPAAAATPPKVEQDDAPRQIRTAPAAHSILDDEVPNFSAVAMQTDAGSGEPGEENIPKTDAQFRSAAKNLFDAQDPNDVVNPIRNKSLAVIERTERRQERFLHIVLALLALLLVGGGVLLFLHFQNSLGSKPNAKSYGTAAFDTRAQEYLTKAAQKRTEVAAYLAFPGQVGQLVYTSAVPQDAASYGGAQAASTQEDAQRTYFETQNLLSTGTPSNTVINCGDALAGMSDADTLKSNSGFTLYGTDETYRCKVLAVYYWDPAETGGSAFNVTRYTDLSGYYDYLGFVWGTHVRTLYDTGVEVPDDSSFLTLVSDSDTSGVKLCVTGRLIAQNEDAQLSPSAIVENTNALLTTAQYAAKGEEAPSLNTTLSDAAAWYTTRTLTVPASTGNEPENADSSAESDDLTQHVADLQDQTNAILSSTDELLKGLTDVAGNGNAAETAISQGAEGASLPSADVTVASLAATATPAPTQAQTDAAASASDSGASGDASQGAAATDSGSTAPSGGSSAEGETINVTMNGSAQSMDLVTCLAMVAQNELGSNAPLEAYKAQCVATHCWLLSQGGYPSVNGQSPGGTATQAAQAVAHVLITYNGSVCFTPYFASASTGTASAQDVWGSNRAYLQAVDSPYDQSFASNWNTNGNASGSALFTADSLRQAVQDKTGIDLSGVDKNNWFKILSSNQYGWVSQMQLGPDGGSNTTCSGRWFRETLTAGRSVDGRSLRSQCFTLSYDGGRDCFVFDVYGYGHGCGMSQWGAVGYAQNGWSYDAILTHYFSGVSLTTY